MAETGRRRDGRSTLDQARKLKAIAITGGAAARRTAWRERSLVTKATLGG